MDRELLRIMMIKQYMALGLSDEKAMRIVKAIEDRHDRKVEGIRSLMTVYWDRDSYWRVGWQRIFS